MTSLLPILRLREKEDSNGPEILPEAICMSTFSPFDGSPAMQALLEEAFRGRDKETKPVPYKDAIAALTFKQCRSQAHHRRFEHLVRRGPR